MKFSCPPGFIIRAKAFKIFTTLDQQPPGPVLPKDLLNECMQRICALEEELGLSFGSGGNVNPLLVSIRCGTSIVVPDLSFSVINVGMNDTACEALEKWSGNRWFSLNVYANFLFLFGVHVMHVAPSIYAEIVREHSSGSAINDFNFSVEILEKVVKQMKAVIDIPENPHDQIQAVILSIYLEWNSKCQRHCDDSPPLKPLFPAVTIQAMAHGNFNNNSGSGVLFSRDPVTGKAGLHGDFIYQLAGRGVTDGTELTNSVEVLKVKHPDLFEKLQAVVLLLELEFKDMQRTEFVVQDGKYFILGTQQAARSALAGIKILVDMVKERLITPIESILRVDAKEFHTDSRLLTLDPLYHGKLSSIGYGTAVSLGFVSGAAAFSLADVYSFSGSEKIIFICEDLVFHGREELLHTDGIICLNGAMGSHGAMLARLNNIAAVVGVHLSGMKLDTGATALKCPGGQIVTRGDMLTLDGNSGRIYPGVAPSVLASTNESTITLLDWVQGMKKVDVMSEVRSIETLQAALNEKSDGIGVYMFDSLFSASPPEALDQLRLLLMSKTKSERTKHSNLLSDAVSAHMVKVQGLKSGKPLYIKLLSTSICSMLSMNGAEILEFCTRNTISFEEIKENFNHNVTIILGETTLDEDACFSFFCNDVESFSSTCCDTHICGACRFFLSSRDVVNGILNGIIDAVKMIKSKLPQLVSSVELLISDIFEEAEMDSITDSICTNTSLFTEMSLSSFQCNVGLHVHTPKSCFTLERLARRYDMTFAIFDTVGS